MEFVVFITEFAGLAIATLFKATGQTVASTFIIADSGIFNCNYFTYENHIII